MNFTHVEFMPVMEYPYDPSWGYQITGFLPSSRFGCPQDLMYLIEELHKNGIGVILDWVPSHFPGDAMVYIFDGSFLRTRRPKKRFSPRLEIAYLNYGRNEVKSFLISNACFWLDRYHTRWFACRWFIALELDYSRADGEWEPNIYGTIEI